MARYLSYGHPTKWFAFGLDASISQELETFLVLVVPLGHILPEMDASMVWNGMVSSQWSGKAPLAPRSIDI